VRVRVGEAGREGALAAGEDLRALARELAAQAVEDRLRRKAEPAASSPSTTVFFAFSVPAASRAITPTGTAIASAGATPVSGKRSGATPLALS
jgi:hypothetical protein